MINRNQQIVPAIWYLPVFLWLSGLAGSAENRTIEVTITEGTNMAVAASPDGKTLAIDLLGRIWLLPASGGQATALTDEFGDARQPAWSPDGTKIAFQAYWDGNWHIWSIERDGSNLRQLTHGPFDHREPHWAPRSDKIICSSDRHGRYDLWSIDLTKKEIAPLTGKAENEYAPAWSPDGTQVAFISEVTGENSLRILTISDGSTQLLYRSAHALSGPSWSPDGQKISFNAIGEGDGALFTIEIKSKQLQQISTPDEDVFPFRANWIAGGRLQYTSNGKITEYTGGVHQEIPFTAVVRLQRPSYPRRKRNFDDDSGRPAKGIVAPALSPDGESIAFIALGDLWLQAKGEEAVNLTKDRFLEMTPSWSPDGKALFYCSDKAGSVDIWAMNIESGVTSRITNLPGTETSPVPSPDGTKIAFTTSAGPRFGKIWTVPAAGGNPEALGGFLKSPGKVTWSPDGKKLATAVLAAYSSRFREGVNQILSIDVESGQSHTIGGLQHWSIGSRTYDGPIWSPDGKWMAFVSSGLLWAVPVSLEGKLDGNPVRLTNELADMPSWAGDSQSILYMATDQLKRVYLADGRHEKFPVNLEWHPRIPANRKIIQAGHVFDGRSGNLQENVDIIIESNRIIAIEPHDPNRIADEFIDAKDGFVMPGLIDMHSHQSNWDGEKLGRTWLSWGVTTTRDPTASPYDALSRQETQRAGLGIGPRVFFTGSSIDGNRVYYGGTVAQQNPAQLEQELERARRLEYDMVKTYVRLADPVQKRVVTKAHQMGVPVSSHELYPAVAYGVDGVEHIRGTSRRGYSPKVSETSRTYGDVIQLLASSGMYLCPTAALSGGFRVLLARDPSILDDLRFRTFSNPEVLRNRAGLISKDSLAWEKTFVHVGNTVKRVIDAGGLVIAGTDSPILPFGVSLHLELECYAVGGLSNFEILKTATINAAKVLGVEEDLGTIRPGKLADLLILNSNPLENIRNARDIRTVVQNGRVFQMDELLTDG